jgi:hypothetical protein
MPKTRAMKKKENSPDDDRETTPKLPPKRPRRTTKLAPDDTERITKKATTAVRKTAKKQKTNPDTPPPPQDSDTTDGIINNITVSDAMKKVLQDHGSLSLYEVHSSFPQIIPDIVNICEQYSFRPGAPLPECPQCEMPVNLDHLPPLFTPDTIPRDECCPKVLEILDMPQWEQGTQLWKDVRDGFDPNDSSGVRRCRITSADVASALKVRGAFKSWNDLFISKGKVKLHDALHNGAPFPAPPQKDPLMFRHGTFFEDIVLRLYSKATGKKVIKVGLILHPSNNFIGASIDGITAEDAIPLEAKVPIMRVIEPGVVMPHYGAQIQTAMETLGLEKNHFIQYKPGDTWSVPVFDVTEVQRDRDWFDGALPKIRDMCEQVNTYLDGGPLPKAIQKRVDEPKRKRARPRPDPWMVSSECFFPPSDDDDEPDGEFDD